MDATIGLVGFPTLLDHMVSRILADYEVQIERLDVERAAPVMKSLNLAFFFWPDKGDQGCQRLKQLVPQKDEKHCPVIVVANPIGELAAQQAVGTCAKAVLLTPLRPSEVIDALSKFAGLSSQKVHKAVSVDYVNSLLGHTLRTLTELTGLECERSNMQLSTEAMTTGHVSGTVAFSGGAEGFITVSFPRNLAAKIACATMSARGEYVTDIEISASIGELIESIAHAAKANVSDLREQLRISPPQVFAGGPHIVAQLRGEPVFVFEFRAASEIFSLLICLRRKAA